MAVNINTAVCLNGIPCGLHETCQHCSSVRCLSLRYTISFICLDINRWNGKMQTGFIWFRVETNF